MDWFLLVLFVAAIQTAAANARCGSSKSGQEKATTNDGKRLLFFPNGRELWMVRDFPGTPRTILFLPLISISIYLSIYLIYIIRPKTSQQTQMKGQLPYRRYYERTCIKSVTPGMPVG